MSWNSSTGQQWWVLLFHHFIFSLSLLFFLLFSGCVSASAVTDGEALLLLLHHHHIYLLLLLSLSLSPFLSVCLSFPREGKSLRMRAHVNHRALMWWLLPVTCQPYGRWHHSHSWYVTPSPVAHGCHTHTHTHTHTCIHAHLLTQSLTRIHKDTAKTHVRSQAPLIRARVLGERHRLTSAPVKKDARFLHLYSDRERWFARSCGPWRWSESKERFFFSSHPLRRARAEVSWNKKIQA